MRSLISILAVSAFALTACSGADAEPTKTEETTAKVDEAVAAWEDALDEATNGTVDFAIHQQDTAVACQRTERKDWIVDFALGGMPTAGTDVVLLGLEHACPDVAQVYAAAIDEVGAAPDPKSLVCADPKQFGTEDQLKLQIAC